MDFIIGQLEVLRPRAVIAGHKKPENDDDPCNLGRHGSICLISIAWTKPRRLRSSSMRRC